MLPLWIALAAATSTAAPPGAGGASLMAAAAASGRPRECAPGTTRGAARGPSVWHVARVPELQRYCDLLARAQAELGSAPETARASAAAAEEALPGHAAPAVILARAALSAGALDDAARAFDKARGIDARSIEDPATMHDLARVLRRTGRKDDALATYRALVPRIELLPSEERRVAVLLEAAHASLSAGAPGDARLDEAIAYLREARQRPPTRYAGDVALSLALALDRAGRDVQADAALEDARRAGAKPRSAGEYLTAAEDELALDALAREASDRAAATKAWEAFLGGRGGSGPWASAARARLDRLRKGGGAKTATRDASSPSGNAGARRAAKKAPPSGGAR